MEALGPIFSAISAIGSGVGIVKDVAGMFGGGKPKAEQAAMPVQSAKPAPSASPALPGTSPTDFTREQNAYWQNLLAGQGQGTEGGQLPQGISDMIQKQASLIT